MSIVDKYAEMFGVDLTDRTKAKEKIGEKIIRKYHLFDILFPDNTGYKKVSDKKHQIAGVDYEVYTSLGETVYIDLKSCVGPEYEEIPVEIRQNGYFTNVKSKLTDFMLYILCDEKGIRYCNVPYQTISKLSYQNDYYWCKSHNLPEPKLEHHTSFNKSGDYIKVPVKQNILMSL